MRLFDAQTKRRLINRFLPTAAAILLSSGLLSVSPLAQEDQFAGERVVHLLEEPRHRTVHHDGLFHVTRTDGITAELDARADWAWHKANQSYVVRNVGRVASAVVINEGRH